jgi:hypothetical protein
LQLHLRPSFHASHFVSPYAPPPNSLPHSPSFPSICRDKLRNCGTVERLVADVPYMSQELDRFQALLRQAGDKWGGGREMSDKVGHTDTRTWIHVVFVCRPFQCQQIAARDRSLREVLIRVTCVLALSPLSNLYRTDSVPPSHASHSHTPSSSLVFSSDPPTPALPLPGHQAADLWLDYSSDTATTSTQQQQQQSHGNPLALPLQVRPARGSTSVMDWLAKQRGAQGRVEGGPGGSA